jgi:hypothetical protein
MAKDSIFNKDGAVTTEALEHGGATEAAQLEEKEKDFDWHKHVQTFARLVQAKESELAGMKYTLAFLVAGHYNEERKAYLKNVLKLNG